MALFHDLAEARTGDLNYVNKRYVEADEDSAFRDAISDLPFSEELLSLWEEWRLGQSLEAKLARDADQLDMMVELSRLAAHGWKPASDWLFYAQKRLATEAGRQLAERILSRDPDGWWFERRDDLWVNPKPPERPRAPEDHEADTGAEPVADPGAEPHKAGRASEEPAANRPGQPQPEKAPAREARDLKRTGP
jgi:hypothetical protein